MKAIWQGRPLWAEVDLDALAHNVRALLGRLNGRCQMVAVVKANGYGHGATAVAKQALAAGAHRLGVACVDEGVQLRLAGIDAPIIILGYTPPWDAQRVVEHGLTPTVTTKQLALAVARFSAERGVDTPVHLKVDTGMSRLGLRPQEAVGFGEFLRTVPHLALEGLYTHFAAADEADKAFTMQQFSNFMAVAERLPWVPYRHVANSAAVLDLPDTALEMVRPGISIYGCYPSKEVGHSVSLRPALNLKSRVVRLHPAAPGDTVSYGRTWAANRPSVLALVPGGYADGLPRSLSNRGQVLIRGVRAPIVGRVCMDQCVVDVTHIPQVALYDEVVIIGSQGEQEIPVEEVAELAGTISYEILCGISARVPRLYIRGGEVVEVRTLVGEQQFTLEEGG